MRKPYKEKGEIKIRKKYMLTWRALLPQERPGWCTTTEGCTGACVHACVCLGWGCRVWTLLEAHHCLWRDGIRIAGSLGLSSPSFPSDARLVCGWWVRPSSHALPTGSSRQKAMRCPLPQGWELQAGPSTCGNFSSPPSGPHTLEAVRSEWE